MEHLDAQRAISDALDREPVDPQVLDAAKEHCRSCAECTEFVRGLSAVKRAAAPVPPDDLVARTMDRIRAEQGTIAAEKVAAIAAGVSATSTPTLAPDSMLAQNGFEALMRRMLLPENRRTLVIYGSIAATLLLFAGISAVAGMRAITQPTLKASGSYNGPPRIAYQGGPAAGGVAAVAPGPAESTASSATTAPAASNASASTPTSSYVVFGGDVYKLTGTSQETTASLSKAGIVASAFGDPSAAPVAHDVYASATGSRIVVDAGPLGALAFDAVVRQYGGATYVLTSAPLERYGVWPTMPPPMQPPTTASGQPGYSQSGVSSGIPAFLKNGSTAAAGIAIPPNTPSTDPAGGNPSWTWWVPQK